MTTTKNTDEEENMDICGESGGEISGYEGCKISLPTEDTNMLGNTSFCITCYEKYESKYYENENVEGEEEECEVCEEGCNGWWDCDTQNKGKICNIHCLEEMCCECKYLGRYKPEEKDEDEEVSLKKKIGAWLSDRDNHEGDLIDFLCDECGVEISSPPSDDEE